MWWACVQIFRFWKNVARLTNIFWFRCMVFDPINDLSWRISCIAHCFILERTIYTKLRWLLNQPENFLFVIPSPNNSTNFLLCWYRLRIVNFDAFPLRCGHWLINEPVQLFFTKLITFFFFSAVCTPSCEEPNQECSVVDGNPQCVCSRFFRPENGVCVRKYQFFCYNAVINVVMQENKEISRCYNHSGAEKVK